MGSRMTLKRSSKDIPEQSYESLKKNHKICQNDTNYTHSFARFASLKNMKRICIFAWNSNIDFLYFSDKYYYLRKLQESDFAPSSQCHFKHFILLTISYDRRLKKRLLDKAWCGESNDVKTKFLGASWAELWTFQEIS